MFVSVQDVNGKTVIRKRLKLGSEEDVAESYIGILTDTPEALSYLDGAGIRYGTLRTRAVFLMPSRRRITGWVTIRWIW
ncbi:MAG: hypothetical protein ACLR3S_05675 [Clostridium fessum]